MLLETVLAMFIMSVVGLALVGMVQRALVVSVKAREEMTCIRMVQTSFVRLKNIDFYHLFAADSDTANYGLQGSYPYRAVLDSIRDTLASSKFDRFRIQVAFMRRDTSDANGNGLTSELVPFTDGDGNLTDDYDPAIRYFDQNGDGDFYDTYQANGRIVAEEPDTHIKRVTVEIFRSGRQVCSECELVSLEQFTGDPNPSSESVLRILVSTPVNSAFLYSLETPSQESAWNLAITEAYPDDIMQYRADFVSPLEIAGETDPLATVKFYVGTSGELADTQADMSGTFSDNPYEVTQAMVEGANRLLAQAVKDAYTSPVAVRSVVLDIVPPVAADPAPTGTAGTLSPEVSILLADPGLSTTTTSGICPEVISLKVNGQKVNFKYDSSTGKVVWIDSATLAVPVLSSGTYTASIEAGDYAGYKTSATWTFELSVPDTDNSAPSIAQKSPIGTTGSDWPEISVRVFDNQSDIVPSSIVMKVDEATVVDSSNLGSHYDAGEGRVFYTPPASFGPGSYHTVEITASHWAANPPEKVTSTDSWGFSVP